MILTDACWHGDGAYNLTDRPLSPLLASPPPSGQKQVCREKETPILYPLDRLCRPVSSISPIDDVVNSPPCTAALSDSSSEMPVHFDISLPDGQNNVAGFVGEQME